MAVSALDSVLSTGSILGTDNSISKLSSAIGSEDEAKDFASVLKNAMVNMLGETQTLIDDAERAEVEFSMGQADSTDAMMIAQKKASIAVSYAVAVRDRLQEAYREIMNMQI